MIPDGVLEPLFVLGRTDMGTPAQRLSEILPQTAAQQAIADAIDILVLASARDYIDARHLAEDARPAALTHAPHESIHHPGFCRRSGTENTHLAKSFQLGFFTHGTGVDQDDIGLGFIGRQLVASRQEHAGDLLRVSLVHLASVGLDEYTGHMIQKLLARRD